VSVLDIASSDTLHIVRRCKVAVLDVASSE
jgi:hypothetical protein